MHFFKHFMPALMGVTSQQEAELTELCKIQVNEATSYPKRMTFLSG